MQHRRDGALGRIAFDPALTPMSIDGQSTAIQLLRRALSDVDLKCCIARKSLLYDNGVSEHSNGRRNASSPRNDTRTPAHTCPGEATKWHTDPLHRVSVVLKGEALRIEFRDGS